MYKPVLIFLFYTCENNNFVSTYLYHAVLVISIIDLIIKNIYCKNAQIPHVIELNYSYLKALFCSLYLFILDLNNVLDSSEYDNYETRSKQTNSGNQNLKLWNN